MTTYGDLQKALNGLETERIQRLVDRLESDPDIRVTVGGWRPRCPMVLSGFDPSTAAVSAPEVRFAKAWDQFALAAPWRWWRPVQIFAARTARRSDVQLLLRNANRVLAERAAVAGELRTSTRASSAGSSASPEDGPDPTTDP